MAKAKGKAPPARWLREAQGVVALGLAAYVTVALLSYDSTLHWLDQGGRVGVVGLWIGWAMFTAVGYAGYLVPLALVAWATLVQLRLAPQNVEVLRGRRRICNALVALRAQLQKSLQTRARVLRTLALVPVRQQQHDR